MSKALVLTVGVGKDVDRSLVFATDQHNPDFVLFLCTPQSRSNVDKVVQTQSLPESRYKIEEFQEINDVQELALQYEKVIRRVLFRDRGFQPNQVYVDYTRGTKAMSAAVDYVAINLELAGVSYIEGERDERGQVKSGTERLLSFPPSNLLFRRHWKTLVQLFNAGHFASVLNRIEDLQWRIVREEHKRRLNFVEQLAKACEAWDVLHYEDAAQGLRQVLKDFEDIVQDLGLENELKRASPIVHGIWNSRCKSESCRCGLPLNEAISLDILANADRRAKEHRYDVAVALLYRLMEYIAQRRLHDKGIRSDNVCLGVIPEAVRPKWESRVGPDGRLKVGMLHGYELLADLGDELGQHFLNLYRESKSRLKPYLECRNISPLAHGFQPVGQEAFQKLRDVVVEDFLSKLVQDRLKNLNEYHLPQLPEDD